MKQMWMKGFLLQIVTVQFVRTVALTHFLLCCLHGYESVTDLKEYVIRYLIWWLTSSMFMITSFLPERVDSVLSLMEFICCEFKHLKLKQFHFIVVSFPTSRKWAMFKYLWTALYVLGKKNTFFLIRLLLSSFSSAITNSVAIFPDIQ